jgi:hypothetical protein
MTYLIHIQSRNLKQNLNIIFDIRNTSNIYTTRTVFRAKRLKNRTHNRGINDL